MMMRRSWAGGALAVLGLGFSAAFAQVTPGQVMDTLPRPTPPPAPEAPVIETPSTTTGAPVASAGLSVTVQRFGYRGNTVFDGGRLNALTAPYRGRPIGLAELYAAADAITDLYHEYGYTLATVNLPPQTITAGEVIFEIIEGRVGTVSLEGNERYREAQLRESLSDVEPGSLFRAPTVSRALQRLNELPGLSARAVARPGSQFGHSDLVVRLHEQRWNGVIGLDNHGRESTGELRLSGGAQWHNPFGIGDQLQFFGLISEDALLQFGQIGYSLPVNRHGTRLSMQAGHARFEVASDLDVEGDSTNLRLGLNHAFYATPQERLEVHAAVTHGSSEGRVLDVVTSGNDITLLEVGGSLSFLGSRGALSRVAVNASSNFSRLRREDLLQASGGNNRQRLRIGIHLYRREHLPAGLLAEFSLDGVFSPDPLVDSQQFSVGGPYSVRGYPAAEIRGDRGYAASLSLSRPMRRGEWLLAPKIFADYGEVYRDEAALRGVTGFDSLASLGFGGDLRWRRWFLRTDLAFPTDNHVVAPGADGRITNGRDVRLFANLGLTF